MTDDIILQNVTAGYGQTVALHNVSANFPVGSLTAIAGPNGAGKSTLLKVAAGILRPRRGTVHVARSIAYLPQLASLQRDFPMTVPAAAATGLFPQLGNLGAISAAARARLRSALHEVGLQGLEHRLLGELSGGQFQRLLFSRILVQNAPIILLDEPFTGVDEGTVKTLIQLIRCWHEEEGKTVLCVLHDAALIARHFPRALVFDDHGGTTLKEIAA